MPRRMPIGAEFITADTVEFRVWAPRRQRVEVVLEPSQRSHALRRDQDGYFSGRVADVGAGMDYRYRLDGGESFPDPVSRFQPDGPHGPSRLVEPSSFAWTDRAWRGLPVEGQVFYELHIGTFTPEGTWTAAVRHLPELVHLGVTAIEVMPVADFPGRHGWGYDGVCLFAPTRLYGPPDDFRRFVDRAHALGLGVVLDVVYNHFGPDGNYIAQFSTDFATDRYAHEWGDALNFDGPNSGPVREFFTSNAAYWIREFHLDGLRLDATNDIHDASPMHILAEINDCVREAAAGRSVLLIAENDLRDINLLRPRGSGGSGLDYLWNDDFHHACLAALTARPEDYYANYRGTMQELVSTAKWGLLFQGQRYEGAKKPLGSPTRDVPPNHFVNFLENHDQLANPRAGTRCHLLTNAARHRAMTAFLLLAPGTPLLFQGQEFNASAPFHYFVDHHSELAEKVAAGRREFMSRYPGVALDQLYDPTALETFQVCKLDHGERMSNAAVVALHRDLLFLRRSEVAFRTPKRGNVDGAVLNDHTFLLRYFADKENDRLLIVNLGSEVHFHPAPEPLLAPPARMHWELHWTSEDTRYGGSVASVFDPSLGWRIPAEGAWVFRPTVV